MPWLKGKASTPTRVHSSSAGSPDVPFNSDGAYSLIFGFGDASAFSLLVGCREKTKQTVLHSFRDKNGDGVADLLTHSLEGRSMLRQRSV